ncbi:lysM domain receptor-like kinase 3 [Typha latifolia]|uniref:lysM domain receptor-like kinase 3 n=1 Tax=Typha latifolia TaxID=4733 RepID=UPI003C2EF1EA
MCKSKSAIKASTPTPRPRSSRSTTPSASAAAAGSYSAPAIGSTSASSTSKVSSSSSSSSSLAAIRGSLPSPPAIYPFSEIAAATNNFLAKRLSSSSPSWRCSLRGKDAVVFQRAFRGDPAAAAALPSRLAALGKSHHKSLVRLLGASLAGDHIYLAYEFSPGASLADCLRNPRNPNFTPLPTWTSRIQIADDVAQGLEYIHHHFATVHNRIKSSAVIVTEAGLHGKICHFGTAALAGEVPSDDRGVSPAVRRSRSRRGWIEGTRGYMAPEIIAGERFSPRSDVYAFGVVLLELVSGEEPMRYRYDKARKEFEAISLVETAAAAAEREREGLRQWVDRRLRDSFPVEAMEKLIHVALRCVDAEPAARPEMTWVAGKVSKLYLESKAWEDTIRLPTDFSVSLAPR